MSKVFEERIATYDRIKQAYNVRSKVVHGDKLSKGAPQTVKLISRELDQLVRSVLLNIINSSELTDRFNNRSSDLERYFLEQSFS